MPQDWTRIEEGDAVTATSLNARFSATVGELNALEELTVAPYSLHREHLQTTAREVTTAEIAATTNHTYTSASEPYPGYGLSAGWKVVNTNGSAGTGTKLEALFTGSGINMKASGNILILANVHFILLEDANAAPTILGPFNGACMFAIQYRISGTWYTLPRSERYTSAATTLDGTGQLAVYKDVPIRTYLTYTDVAGKGSERVQGIRVVVSLLKPAIPAGPIRARLREGNLTAISLYAGSL
jgi:hypothetical protein